MTRLQGHTGHESPAAARDEFDRLLKYLGTVKGLMEPAHLRFVENMEREQQASGTFVPSAKALFYLRDLNVLY